MGSANTWKVNQETIKEGVNCIIGCV